MKTAIIGVKGGVAFPVKIPAGVRVMVRDYDTQGTYRDKLGEYARSIYKGAKRGKRRKTN